MTGDISPGAIARIHDVIRPYIRHTPILRANGADVGLAPFPLTFKLEFVPPSRAPHTDPPRRPR